MGHKSLYPPSLQHANVDFVALQKKTDHSVTSNTTTNVSVLKR